MNPELQQLIDALKEQSSDIERKQFFNNVRASFISLLADVWEGQKDYCESIIRDIIDTFPKPRGPARQDIVTFIKMELNRRVKERNADHFTEEVNFERDAQGNVKATIENMVTVLLKNKNLYITRDEFTGMYFYAAYGTYNLPWGNSTHSINIEYVVEHTEKKTKSIRYYNAMGQYELASLKLYMQQFFKTETNWRMLREAIIQASQQNVFNMYQDFIRYGLPEWDGISRLDFFHRHAGVKNRQWAIVAGRVLLMSLMARCFQPGFNYRGIIILEGKQDSGKSRTCEAFSFHPEFFTQFTFDKNHNEYEVSRRIAGKAVVEFPDMGGITNRDINYIKAFFTSTEDSNRRMHSDVVENIKRSWVAMITTNYSEPYLNDQTGNTRYIPIHCDIDKINVEAIIEEMPMLLAEAFAMWNAGETPRLSDDEKKLQMEMLKPREIVSDYYHWLLPILKLHQKQFIRTDEHWDDGETLEKIVDWCASEEWFPSKQRHYHKRKISAMLESHFNIKSIVRHNKENGSNRKYRYDGNDFETFLNQLSNSDDG